MELQFLLTEGDCKDETVVTDTLYSGTQLAESGGRESRVHVGKIVLPVPEHLFYSLSHEQTPGFYYFH